MGASDRSLGSKPGSRTPRKEGPAGSAWLESLKGRDPSEPRFRMEGTDGGTDGVSSDRAPTPPVKGPRGGAAAQVSKEAAAWEGGSHQCGRGTHTALWHLHSGEGNRCDIASRLGHWHFLKCCFSDCVTCGQFKWAQRPPLVSLHSYYKAGKRMRLLV